MNKTDEKKQNTKFEEKQGHTHGSVGANTVGLEAGMFMRAHIKGVHVRLFGYLVDRGRIL